MNVTKCRFVIGMALAAALLAIGPRAATAREATADDDFRSAAPGTREIATIAILPVASVSGNADAERLVEESWTEFRGDGGIRWLRADEVRIALARTAPGPVDLDAVHAQIWRRGEVDCEAAGRLARSLGVDAVLSVRIDRWEIADGGRAIVEMTAALSGADGARLWSISGVAGCGAPRGSAKRHFSDDLGTFWSRRLEPRELGREKLGCALYMLLSRWEGSLPAAPAYARQGGPGVAEPTTID